MVWAIEAAQSATRLSRTIITTDDEKIAAVARGNGLEVPFMRPPELARDDTPGIEPVIHALEWLAQNEDYRPDYVVLLQPTSPLRTSDDVDNAIRLAEDKGADSVVSVTLAKQHPHWMKIVDRDGKISPFMETESTALRRQDLPSIYALNGAIYLARPMLLLESRTWYNDNTYSYEMPADRSIDIDSEWDRLVAEQILSSRVEV